MAERLFGWRVVARPESIDQLEGRLLRFAPDDGLVLGGEMPVVDDPAAIIEPDSGWVSMPSSEEMILGIISRYANWEAPVERPGLAQGMLAGLPAKVYLDGERSMIVVASPYQHELEERLGQEPLGP